VHQVGFHYTDDYFTLIAPPVFNSAVYCIFVALDSHPVKFISCGDATFEVRFVPDITPQK